MVAAAARLAAERASSTSIARGSAPCSPDARDDVPAAAASFAPSEDCADRDGVAVCGSFFCWLAAGGSGSDVPPVGSAFGFSDTGQPSSRVGEGPTP